MTRSDAIYEPAGFAMLRAPVLPVSAYPATTSTAGADVRQRLKDTARDPRIAHAVHVASPSLTAALGTAFAEPDDAAPAGRKAARATSTLLRYVTRMSTRPTPYGLFAAVGAAHFGPHTSLRLAADPVARTRTRADSAWILALIRSIEDSDLRAALSLGLNPMLYRSGDRVVLPIADVYGQGDNRLIDVRATLPVEVAFQLAAAGGAVEREFVERLVELVPGATADRAATLVGQLRELHFLVGDLRPATTAALPETDLLKRLDGIAGADHVRDGLLELRRLADVIDDGNGRTPVADLDRLVTHQRGLTPGYDGPTYQVDAALALVGSGLNAEVGATVAQAADLLLRLGCTRPRPPHIVDYHQEFLERYGVDAEIPLLEVLSPERGLDAPAPYTSPARSAPLPSASSMPEDEERRNRRLAAVLSEVLHDGLDRLELTDERIGRLSVWDPATGPAPRPALDIFGCVVADSATAIDEGRWSFVVSPGPMADGGRTFGRFSDLLAENDVDLLRCYARDEESRCPGLAFVELSYLSPYGRSGNVAISPRLRRREICLNTAAALPTGAQVALADILVGASGDRFYLRSAATGEELRVTQSHMLTATSAPNVCRLLLELSDDAFAPLAGWDWGTAATAPYLPRVCRDRLVLAPAQWTLTWTLLGVAVGDRRPGPDAYRAALGRWRDRWRVPRYVYLSYLDNRLLLDLDDPAFVAELHAEMARSGHRGAVLLQEALPGPEHAWLTDTAGRRYMSEVVVPLLVRDRVNRPAVNTRPPRSRTETERPRRRLVGEEWLHLKLYAAVPQHDDLLVGDIADLIDGLRTAGSIDRWFFIRYFDPMPHLRIRLRIPDADAVLPVTGAAIGWARDVVRAGRAADLVVASYDREIERYGGPAAIDDVERAFEAGSDTAVRLIRTLRADAPDVDRDVAAVLALHTLHRQWGTDPLRSGAALHVGEVSGPVRRRFRQVRRALTDLIEPWPDHPDPQARRWRAPLVGVMNAQTPVVADVSARVRALHSTGELFGTPARVLASLAHMQTNRLFGVDTAAERECHEMWALALGAISRRPAGRSAHSGEDGNR